MKPVDELPPLGTLVIGADAIDEHVPLPTIVPHRDLDTGDHMHTTPRAVVDRLDHAALGVVVTDRRDTDVVLGQVVDELDRCPDTIALEGMQVEVDGVIGPEPDARDVRHE